MIKLLEDMQQEDKKYQNEVPHEFDLTATS